MRIGIVGLGRAAAQLLPSLAAHPHVAVVAAADPSVAARARFTADYGALTFEDVETMCSGAELDAVYVATPHQRHAADVLIAAGHGLHVLVEKPMALTLEDCTAMTDAAARAGVALVVGHTHGFDPAVRAMRAIVASGEAGALRQIVSLAYTNFLYRARRPEELDSAQGGGILFNQVPHQIEIARALDGGPLRSVRATAGRWDAARPAEGALSALLEFEDGVAASLVYSGYDRFDSDELTGWIGEMGDERGADRHGAARRALAGVSPDEEQRRKAASGFAGRGAMRASAGARLHQPHFGFLLASCERADLRPSADGVLVYDERGVREIPLPPGRAYPNKDAAVDELYDAFASGTPPLHDGRWGTVTVAAMLALAQSARERREIVLTPREESVC